MTSVRAAMVSAFGSDTVRFPAPVCEWSWFEVGEGDIWEGESGESELRPSYFDRALERCADMFATLENLGGSCLVTLIFAVHDPAEASEVVSNVAAALGTERSNWTLEAVPLSPELREDYGLEAEGPERDCWMSHAVPLNSEQYLRLAELLVWQDFPRRATTYFDWARIVNIERRAALWVYDDRGAIVLATEEGTLQPFIDSFGRHLTGRGTSRPSPDGVVSWFDIWSPGLG